MKFVIVLILLVSLMQGEFIKDLIVDDLTVRNGITDVFGNWKLTPQGILSGQSFGNPGWYGNWNNLIIGHGVLSDILAEDFILQAPAGINQLVWRGYAKNFGSYQDSVRFIVTSGSIPSLDDQRLFDGYVSLDSAVATGVVNQGLHIVDFYYSDPGLAGLSLNSDIKYWVLGYFQEEPANLGYYVMSDSIEALSPSYNFPSDSFAVASGTSSRLAFKVIGNSERYRVTDNNPVFSSYYYAQLVQEFITGANTTLEQVFKTYDPLTGTYSQLWSFDFTTSAFEVRNSVDSLVFAVPATGTVDEAAWVVAAGDTIKIEHGIITHIAH